MTMYYYISCFLHLPHHALALFSPYTHTLPNHSSLSTPARILASNKPFIFRPFWTWNLMRKGNLNMWPFVLETLTVAEWLDTLVVHITGYFRVGKYWWRYCETTCGHHFVQLLSFFLSLPRLSPRPSIVPTKFRTICTSNAFFSRRPPNRVQSCIANEAGEDARHFELCIVKASRRRALSGSMAQK